MNRALSLLLERRSLERAHAEQVMAQIVDGAARPEQVGAFLIALRIKEESVEEISGFLDCLRKRALRVRSARPDLMDVCGTGGDGSGTFNVSTTVAFVVAAAGQPIAKHGNRSVSSRSGSFDVLEALGLGFESDPERAARSLEDHGIALLFAPAFHPALKTLAPMRKSLGVHTIFNALGPLLNPAPIRRQLMGVYSPLLLEKVAQVIQAGGELTEAMVVRGEDGLDELSLSAPTQVAHFKNGQVRAYAIRPEDCGLKSAPAAALKGGDAAENAAILVSILRGEPGPRRDMVLLNAGAALLVGGKAAELREGVERAAAAIDSGAALALIRRLGARV
jgi:anthranilate phosphoribosyltransferase